MVLFPFFPYLFSSLFIHFTIFILLSTSLLFFPPCISPIFVSLPCISSFIFHLVFFPVLASLSPTVLFTSNIMTYSPYMSMRKHRLCEWCWCPYIGIQMLDGILVVNSPFQIYRLALLLHDPEMLCIIKDFL